MDSKQIFSENFRRHKVQENKNPERSHIETIWYGMVQNGAELCGAKSRILANVNTLIAIVDSLQFVT